MNANPAWITTDRSGNIYVSGDKVVKFSPSGSALLTITTPYAPGDVRIGNDGTIYLADYFGGNVYRYSASGMSLGLFFATGMSRADYMAFDRNGNLYVTDLFSGAIRHISPTGVDLGNFATHPGVVGIAFDASGNLYAASYTTSLVEKFSPSGTDLGVFASIGSGQAYGLAFDSGGNLLVGTIEGSIRKFSPSGTDLGVFATTTSARDLIVYGQDYQQPAAAPMFNLWLSVTPPFARTGDIVAFTLTGPPGDDATLAYSHSTLGFGQLNGQDVLLGPDATIVATGTIGAQGVWASSVQIPSGLLGEFFLQGAAGPPGGPLTTLTNGTSVLITPTSGAIIVTDFFLGLQYACGSPTVQGIEFRAALGAFAPVREATMQTPTGAVYRMRPVVSEDPAALTASGYRNVFEFGDNDLPGTPDQSLFPDGTYTFTATFPDGTTATATAVLGGAFPAAPTFVTPACGATGVSRGPAIQFTASGAASFDVTTSVVLPQRTVNVWRYRGTATTVTMPSNLLWPSTSYGLRIDAYAPSTTTARKSAFTLGNFVTGP